MLEIVRITDWNDPRIDLFGELQEKAYFDSDMLIPMWVIKQTMLNPSPHRNDVLLIAEEDGKLLGGTLFHYLPLPMRVSPAFWPWTRTPGAKGWPVPCTRPAGKPSPR